MNRTEKEYSSLCLRLGGALLLFVGMIQVSGSLYLNLSDFLPSLMGEKNAYITANLIYGFLYLASFMGPAFFFRILSKKHPTEPLRLMPRFPKNFPLLVIFVIGVCTAAAILNNFLMLPFLPPVGEEEPETIAPYQFVMQLIVTALVPGVCEEFLFRGTILSNLMPYGKTGAILISALLFGLMHGNPAQMFYTTMAGVILGCVYVYTDSLFCGMLAHVLNNAVAVVQETIQTNLPELEAYRLNLLINAALFGLTLLSVLLLAKKEKKKKDAATCLQNGVYGKDLPEAEGYVRIPIRPGRRLKLFFTPTMTLFVVFQIIEMAIVLIALMVQ